MIPPAEIGSDLAYMVVFLFLAAVFYLVEICTPTFGVMAFTAAAAEITAIVFSFRIGTGFGFLVLFISIVGTPIYLYFVVKFLPKTPLGKLLMLKKGRAAADEAVPEAKKLKSLKGKRGITQSVLRPVGKVRIEGSVYDARTERAFIDSGVEIAVIRTCGTDVVVRTVNDNDNKQPDKDQQDQTNSE